MTILPTATSRPADGTYLTMAATMNAPKPSATALQFPLRSLALAVLLVALLLGAVSPWLREFNAAQLWRFGLVWLVAIVCAMTIVVCYGVLRRRAERKSGKVCYEVRTVGGPIVRGFWIVMGIFNVGMVLFYAFFDAIVLSGLYWTSYMCAFSMGTCAGISLTMNWWRVDRIRLREHGLLVWLTLMPWESLPEWRWDDDGRRSLLVLRIQNTRFRMRSTVRTIVAEEEKEAIEAFLQERCPGRRRSA